MAASGARAPGAGTGDGLPGPAGDAARPGRERRVPALLGVLSARTWLALINLLAGAVTSTLAFLVVVTSVSVGVVPAAGLPGRPASLLAAVWLCQQFARVERARFALLTGTQILGPPPQPPAGSVWRGLWRYFTAASTWRFFVYVVFAWPLQLAGAIVVTAVWGVAVAAGRPARLHPRAARRPRPPGPVPLEAPPGWPWAWPPGLVLLLGAAPLTRRWRPGTRRWPGGCWAAGPGRS